jgi:hypothetical protein
MYVLSNISKPKEKWGKCVNENVIRFDCVDDEEITPKYQTWVMLIIY